MSSSNTTVITSADSSPRSPPTSPIRSVKFSEPLEDVRLIPRRPSPIIDRPLADTTVDEIDLSEFLDDQLHPCSSQEPTSEETDSRHPVNTNTKPILKSLLVEHFTASVFTPGEGLGALKRRRLLSNQPYTANAVRALEDQYLDALGVKLNLWQRLQLSPNSQEIASELKVATQNHKRLELALLRTREDRLMDAIFANQEAIKKMHNNPLWCRKWVSALLVHN